MIRLKDLLLQHSLWLMGATAVGNVVNYLFHVICGRMMPESEYGLLIALFGGVNLLLVPMTALGVVLARSVALSQDHSGLGAWFRYWTPRFALGALVLLVLAVFAAPTYQGLDVSGRAAPLVLAASIPALNLFLTLTGAGLQGIQAFRDLSIRGSLLFVVRALLVGLCLHLGFRAAGWAILAHLLGMAAALGFSLWALRSAWTPPPREKENPFEPQCLDGLGAALPVLISFAVLLSADVVMVRVWCTDLSGAFAQSATLGRMILWLPLPIAQAMFPKVVRSGTATSEHRNTALRAVAYSLVLVLPALIACWLGAGFALRIMFGDASPLQVQWMRGVALAMVPLAPLHVWIHYELARGKLVRLLPILGGAVVYLLLACFRHDTPQQILQALQVSTSTALVCCLGGLILSKR